MTSTEAIKNVIFSMEDFEKAKEYWLEKLSGDIEEIYLPRDFDPGSECENARLECSIPAEISRELLSLTRNQDILLYVVLLAALDILIFKYTGKGEVIVSAPIYTTSREHYDYNHAIAFKETLAPAITVKEFLSNVKKTVIEGYKNQHYPVEKILEHLGLDKSGISLSRLLLMLENIHKPDLVRPVINSPANDLAFSFLKTPGGLDVNIHYNARAFKKVTAERIFKHYTTVLKQMLEDIDGKVMNIRILSPEEEEQLVKEFNDTTAPYPGLCTIHGMFAERVDKAPGNTAVVFEKESLTYRQLDALANRVANYLVSAWGIQPDDGIGILMDRCLHLSPAIWGVMKAGGAYVPMDPAQPEDMLKQIINDTRMKGIISLKKYIRTLNRLQWECPSLHAFLCMDSENIRGEDEVEKSGLMDKKLWEYIGKRASDDITGGGWFNSYTGEPFSREEMEEYGDNILKKLTPHLYKQMRVLEIGCASGISMYRIAPHVGYYYGTDISDIIIQKNKERVKQEGHHNIELACFQAEEIDQINQRDFDLVIINSVIQGFHGHNYLVKIIRKSIDLLKPRGHLFIGDVMNQDSKSELIRSLVEYKNQHKDSAYKINTDLSGELFISPAFLEDLPLDIPAIREVEITGKIYTIENELTKFRYDAFFTIDKSPAQVLASRTRHRYQHDSSTLRNYDDNRPVTRVGPQNLVYIIYTSGTTGSPKGVMVEHGNLMNFVQWRIAACNYSPLDITLQLMSVAFDAFAGNFYPPFLSGGKIVFIGEEKLSDYDYIRQVIEEEKVTNFSVLPSMYSLLLEGGQPGILDTVRLVILGGERAEKDLVHLSQSIVPHVALINEYGPTENSVTTTANMELTRETVSIIGKPIANNRVYMISPHGEILPPGIPGELWVSGDGMARGYLNEPGLTAKKFLSSSNRANLPASPYISQKIYKTGDLARWLPDGNIEFLGRIDEQVKIRGYRIEPAEIQKSLILHPGIKEAVVVPIQVGDSDTQLCAYWLPRVQTGAPEPGDVLLETQDLKQYLAAHLPDYKIPQHFVRLDRIPLTPGGKIDRKALPEPKTEVDARYVAPRDYTEKILARIWAEVLGITRERIGIDDDFFQLGGHSLKATLLILKMKKEFHVKVPLEVIFNTPTISHLAGYIKKAGKEQFKSIPPAPKQEYYPLSFAQRGLYVHQNRDPSSTTYNEFQAVIIDGEFEVEKLEIAVNRLIRRHDSFRTSFIIVENQPRLRIHEKVTVDIQPYEWDGDNSEVHAAPPGEAPQTGLPEQKIRNFIQPFDLSRAPLLRIGLIKTSAKKYILMIDMHHIITDGVSHDIFVTELLALYQGAELPLLRLQYKDYSVWMNHPEMIEHVEKQKAYWLEVFSGEIPKLQIPLDFERPAVKSFKGEILSFVIEKELTLQLNQLAEETETTLYMVFLTAYYILLWKYSGQEDIVVGSPVTGRNHVDLYNIIGMFVNMLAIRNQPQGNKSLRDFLMEVKQSVIAAMENQDYYFEALVTALELHGDPSRNPLFDAVFALNNSSFGNPRIEGVGENLPFTVSQYLVEYKVSRFDLLIGAFENHANQTIQLLLEYSTDLFKPSTAEKIIIRYISILKQLVEDNDIGLEDIDIVYGLQAVSSSNLQEERGEFEF